MADASHFRVMLVGEVVILSVFAGYHNCAYKHSKINYLGLPVHTVLVHYEVDVCVLQPVDVDQSYHERHWQALDKGLDTCVKRALRSMYLEISIRGLVRQ